MKLRSALLLAVVGAVAAAGCSHASGARATDAAGTPAFRFTGDFVGPLGVQLYSVRGATATDVPGTLARVHALGFDEVETAGTYGMTPAAFRAMLDRAGLRATSMHVGYERFRDSLPAAIADAKTLGARYLGTAWIPHPGGPMTVEQAHAVAADFTRWGRAARDAGLTFFYHIHGYEFVAGPDGTRPIDVLMRETDPDAVHFELDVFWAARPGADPAALLRQYPKRWALMHLKDMRKGTATDVQTGSANADSSEVPVGRGQIDYRAVLRAAREVGVARYYLEDETSAPFTTMPQSTRWLEGVKF
ncbi:MAG: TIM barrel protein [Gemmatirosa sp.]|nr:TIM barrel protein [Gemmatirosa sp.]